MRMTEDTYYLTQKLTSRENGIRKRMEVRTHMRGHTNMASCSKDSEESQWERERVITPLCKNTRGVGSLYPRSHSKVNTKWTINLHVKDKL